MESLLETHPRLLLTRENAEYAVSFGNPDCAQVFVQSARRLGRPDICVTMPRAAFRVPQAEEMLARLSDCGVEIGSADFAVEFLTHQRFLWRPRTSTVRTSILETYLRHGLDPDAVSREDGVRLLNLVWKTSSDPARFALLREGANPNVRLKSKFVDMSENPRVQYGGAAEITPLAFATEGGNLPLTRLLLEKGADVNVPARRYFKSDGSPDGDSGSELWGTALDAALAYGNADVAECLLSHGAELSARADEQLRALLNPGVFDKTGLAAADGDFSGKGKRERRAKRAASIALLEARGVQPAADASPGELMDIRLFVNDVPGAAALLDSASQDCREALAKKVLSHLQRSSVPALIAPALRCVPAESSEAVNAFFSRIQCGDLTGVKTFLECGMNANAVNWTCASALFEAVSSAQVDIVKCLVEHGADIRSSTYPGYTPFSYAEGGKSRSPQLREIADYFREVEASRKRGKSETEKKLKRETCGK